MSAAMAAVDTEEAATTDRLPNDAVRVGIRRLRAAAVIAASRPDIHLMTEQARSVQPKGHGVDDAQRREAVTEWYHLYADRVLAYVTHRTDPDTAQDLVQEVFALAYRKAHRIDEPVIAWLFGTARRLVANQRRGGLRRQALAARIGEQAPSCEQMSSVQEDGNGVVQQALASLPDQDREVLTLAYWYELTPAEAATVLGCRANTFTVRLHRARARLRELLLESEQLAR